MRRGNGGAMVVGVGVGVGLGLGVGACALAAAALVGRRWLLGNSAGLEDDVSVVQAFLESNWVASSSAPSERGDEEAARALHVFSKSRGRAVALRRARDLVDMLPIRLRFGCSSIDVFEDFLHAETARDVSQTCTLHDVRVAFSKFAEERGVHLGRDALSPSRLRRALRRHGFMVYDDVVQAMACTLWC